MEYEVEKTAVESYQKYVIYENWIINGEENKGRPFRPTMKGYYLMNKGVIGYCIVGDILTSNMVWGDSKERNNIEIQKLLNAFEMIYHSNGNYIPIPEIKGQRTAQLSGRNCDTYTHHLNVCKCAIEGNLKNYYTWQTWAKEIWKPYAACSEDKVSQWKKFVKEFYLLDFVDGKYAPKAFVYGREGSDQTGIKKEDSDRNVVKTIQNTIELIIKRNYRIDHGLKDTYDFGCAEFIKYKKEFIENAKSNLSSSKS